MARDGLAFAYGKGLLVHASTVDRRVASGVSVATRQKW